MGARQKEMAIRAALGAGRFRLLRQVLTESVSPLVLWRRAGPPSRRGWHAWAGASHMRSTFLFSRSVRVDGSTLAFTVLATVATGVLFGLAPALQVPAYKLREGLQDAGRGSSGSRPAWLVPRRTGGLRVRPRLPVARRRGTAHSEFSARPGRESRISTGARRRVEDRSKFSDLESRATGLIYRRCVATHPVSPRHRSSRVNRCPAARRGQGLASLGQRAGLGQGPSPGGIYSRRERWILRGPGNSVEVGKRIHGERSSIE